MAIFGFKSKAEKVRDKIDPTYKDVIEEAAARWKLSSESWNDQRTRMMQELRFCDPETQWPEAVRSKREEQGRPCLSIDRLNVFVNQIINGFQQNRPAMQVNPVASGADQQTAEVLQGMIRHIMNRSNGDDAIDTAFLSQVRVGMGWLRVLTEYTTPTSFDQEIVLKRVQNVFQVYPDPSFTELDGSDMNWCIISSDYNREDFIAEFGESKLSECTDSEWIALGDSMPEWVLKGGKGCRVFEYFKRVDSEVTLCQLEDGSVVEKTQLVEGDNVINERKSYKPKVLWYKLCATDVLDQRIWPGKWIPVVPFLGQELSYDGKTFYTGIIHSAKDAQMAINYTKSAQTEAISLAPVAPWVVAAGSIPSTWTGVWSNSHKQPVGYLEYQHKDAQGEPVPPPTRNHVEPAIAAITQVMLGALDDIKGVTGMFDANLGNRESGQSGVAIRQLQNQGQLGNSHYTTNASRSLKHVTRIAIDLIPSTYDTERVVRIIKPDDTTDQVTINGPSGNIDEHTGVESIYRPGVGEYEVVASVGPSYQTRRQENLALLTELSQGPLGQQMATVAPDLLVSMMDFPIAPELSKRLKKTIPPQFQDDQEKQGPDPQQMQMQMQQLMQQHDQLTQALNEAEEELKTRMSEKQMQVEADLQKAQLQEQTKLQIAEMQARLEEQKLELAVIELQAQMGMEQAKLESQKELKELEAESTAHDSQAVNASGGESNE